MLGRGRGVANVVVIVSKAMRSRWAIVMTESDAVIRLTSSMKANAVTRNWEVFSQG